MLVAEIVRQDVRDAIEAIVDRGSRSMANDTLARVSGFFAWAVDKGHAPSNPCTGLKKPTRQQPRERVLDDIELRAIWHAAGVLDPARAAAIRILILTGQRRGEVSGMRWQEVQAVASDGMKPAWVLPPERTKNGKRHEVPLSVQAVAILEARQNGDFPSNRFVFGSNLAHWAPNLDRLKTHLEKSGRGAPLLFAEPWTVHDIRRSVASGLAKMGTPIHVTEQVLNHQSGELGGIRGVYQRYDYAPEKRAALDAWGRHIEAIVTGERGVVVPMKRR